MQTIEQAVEALKSGKTTSLKLVQDSIDTFEADKKSALPLNAFIEMYDDAASLAKAADEEISKARAEGKIDELFEKKPLLGLPFANKDNISVRGKKLTCSSKILDGYVELLRRLDPTLISWLPSDITQVATNNQRAASSLKTHKAQHKTTRQ